jgi:hypothetical protein
MTESDKLPCLDIIREFCAAHRVHPTYALLEFYWKGLQDMPRNDFELAATRLRRESKWMPKPVEFRNATRVEWI